MKRVITVAFLLSVLFVNAQEVPKTAKDQFTKRYPKATDVEWSSNGLGFTADFADKDNYGSAKFNNKGEWYETRTSIGTGAIPDFVVAACQKWDAECEVASAEKVEKPAAVIYEVFVETDDTSYLVTVSNDGKVISSNEVTAEDEDY